MQEVTHANAGRLVERHATEQIIKHYRSFGLDGPEPTHAQIQALVTELGVAKFIGMTANDACRSVAMSWSRRTHRTRRAPQGLSPAHDDLNDLVQRPVVEFGLNMLQAQNALSLHRQQLSLDSRNQRLGVGGNTMSWLLSSEPVHDRAGTSLVSRPVHDLVQVTLQSFWAPWRLPLHSRVRLAVLEIMQSAQELVYHDDGTNTSRMPGYHFDLQVSAVNSRSLLEPCTPVLNINPAISIDRVSLEFSTHDEPLEYPADRGEFTLLPGSPSEYSGARHGMNTGDRVWITSSSASPRIRQQLLRAGGHVVVRLDATRFTIAVDSTGSPADTGVECIFEPARLQLQMQLVQSS